MGLLTGPVGPVGRCSSAADLGRDGDVHLAQLWVLREDWAEQRAHYKEMGLEFPEE